MSGPFRTEEKERFHTICKKCDNYLKGSCLAAPEETRTNYVTGKHETLCTPFIKSDTSYWYETTEIAESAKYKYCKHVNPEPKNPCPHYAVLKPKPPKPKRWWQFWRSENSEAFIKAVDEMMWTDP